MRITYKETKKEIIYTFSKKGVREKVAFDRYNEGNLSHVIEGQVLKNVIDRLGLDPDETSYKIRDAREKFFIKEEMKEI